MTPEEADARRSATHNKRPDAVIVQDVLLDRLKGFHDADASRTKSGREVNDDGDDDGDAAATAALFELANASELGYRVLTKSDDSDNDEVILYIHQDVTACGRHTGGIVWETCFLLLEYAASALVGTKGAADGGGGNDNDFTLGRALEVGAGCGLLGQVLAARQQCRSVVLTETRDVLPNLRTNLAKNAPTLQRIRGVAHVEGCCLDWTESEDGQRRREPALLSSTFDTILGTDVIFAPQLVAPLLDTLRRFSHPTTRVYLCVQVRCPTSHRLFLEQAPSRGFALKDLTCELPRYPSCAWGMDLECHLFLLTRS